MPVENRMLFPLLFSPALYYCPLSFLWIDRFSDIGVVLQIMIYGQRKHIYKKMFVRLQNYAAGIFGGNEKYTVDEQNRY